ncbi:hypothetical protein BCV73_18085 [Paenibacillus sp. SSG-1]|nr:hypothetical protein BCV73_18085 [Paenibacillus sp. SSG-1]
MAVSYLGEIRIGGHPGRCGHNDGKEAYSRNYQVQPPGFRVGMGVERPGTEWGLFPILEIRGIIRFAIRREKGRQW